MYTGGIKRHDRIQIHGAMVTWGINHVEKEDKLDSHQGLRMVLGHNVGFNVCFRDRLYLKQPF